MRPLLLISLLLAVLLAACAPAQPPSPTSLPATPVPVISPLQTPAAPPVGSLPAVIVDVAGVARQASALTVPAMPASADGPWWEAMPEYTLLTLAGYPISGHLMQPQIFVYPVKDLTVNEVAAKAAADLANLLASRQPGETLPFLPLYNSAQVIRAQLAYLDFKNGSGVRYLTQYDQGPLPINNHELIYTYQGLTSDGQYYVAAVLPVNLPGLPADESLPADLSDDYISSFPQYLSDTAAMLDAQPAGAYTPDLAKLDAMIQSLEVR